MPTREIIELNKTPFAVVLNACPRGKLVDETVALLDEMGFKVMQSIVTARGAFSHAVSDGRAVHEYEPEGKAAEELAALFDELKETIKL